MDYIVYGVLQARILEWVVFLFSKGSSQPRSWTQVSHIAGRLFTSWATREAKNTGVGSLSLLPGIFPTQGSNPGLPHCKWILYQLNHKESPRDKYTLVKTLFFLREDGKGIFKTKLRVAVINGGKQQAGITEIHIQGVGSENVKLSYF